MKSNIYKALEFFLNVSLNSGNSVTRIFVITVKGLELAISCLRDQHATTAPARHLWKTGSLNWLQFMLQWFIRFPEFPEFNESSALLGKTPFSSIFFKATFLANFIGTYYLDEVEIYVIWTRTLLKIQFSTASENVNDVQQVKKYQGKKDWYYIWCLIQLGNWNLRVFMLVGRLGCPYEPGETSTQPYLMYYVCSNIWMRTVAFSFLRESFTNC